MPHFRFVPLHRLNRSALLIFCLALTLMLIATLRTQSAIYQHALLLGVPNADSNSWLAWSTWMSAIPDWLLVLGLALLFAWTLWWTAREHITPTLAAFALLMTLLTTGLLLNHARSLSAGHVKNEATAYQFAQQAYRRGDYAAASDVFNRVSQYTSDPAVRLEALGWRSGALYQQHEYPLSVAAACDYIRQASSDARNYQANLRTLHWAIFRVGQSATSLEAAIAQLDSLSACQGLSAASHLWLGISPGLYVAVHEDGFPGDDFLTANSRATLRTLAERYTHEADADLAWLALGEYQRVIQDYPTSPIVNQAYYHLAVHADEAGQLDQAQAYYQAYIDHSPSSEILGSAVKQRIAQILEGQHRPADALEYLIAAGAVNEVPSRYSVSATPWQFERDILYILDVELTADDVQHFIDRHPDLPGREQLQFAWAANLMAEDRYAAARSAFLQLQATLPPESKLHRLSAQNLGKLDRLQLVEKNPAPEDLLATARYLVQPAPIIYNELWDNRRRDTVLNRDTPWAYYVAHNDHLRAIQLLEEFLDHYPQHSQATEATLLLAEAYRTVANKHAFLPANAPTDYQVTTLRQKAIEAYKTFIANNPNNAQLDAALSGTILLYIQWPPRESALAKVQLDFIREHYPQHAFAQQADYWDAYLDCATAVEAVAGTPAWREAFQQAQAHYQTILARSPKDTNAQESAADIDQFLTHPWMSRPGGVVPCFLPNR